MWGAPPELSFAKNRFKLPRCESLLLWYSINVIKWFQFSRRLSSNQETLQWRRHPLIFVMFFINSDSMLSLKAQYRSWYYCEIRSSSVLQPRVSSIVSLFHVVYQQNIFWLFSFPWRCIFVSEEDWAMDEAMAMISDSQYQSPHDLMAP
ncbi:hypothetical protein OIU76_027296 [Salix suchowensis]|nr:hypothetical protein OIU76_027296 [Salix suchowensis]